MTDERADALRNLEDQLGKASEDAERLISEARPTPPPAGWQARPQGGSSASVSNELDSLLSAVRSLRDLVPPEVVHQLAEALKEVLLAIRALIDYYIERLERRREEPPAVEEIPID